MSEPYDPYRNVDPAPPVPSAPPTVQYPIVYPPVSGVPATSPLPVPYPPAPAGYAPVPPQSGYGLPPQPYTPAYGYDPLTGQQLSDKNKLVAGLLQLLPGFLFTLGGIGRLYAGNTALGVAQLGTSLLAWISFWCGFVLLFPFLVTAGAWLWFVIDGIVLMAGRPVDGQGRLLRT